MFKERKKAIDNGTPFEVMVSHSGESAKFDWSAAEYTETIEKTFYVLARMIRGLCVKGYRPHSFEIRDLTRMPYAYGILVLASSDLGDDKLEYWIRQADENEDAEKKGKG